MGKVDKGSAQGLALPIAGRPLDTREGKREVGSGYRSEIVPGEIAQKFRPD